MQRQKQTYTTYTGVLATIGLIYRGVYADGEYTSGYAKAVHGVLMEAPMSTIKQSDFQSFAEFYPYYLQEHGNPTCRRLHFVGTSIVLTIIAAVLAGASAWLLLALPVVGYGFAWVGHYVFEKNRPATFKYPFYSLAGDFVMFKDMLTGRIDW